MQEKLLADINRWYDEDEFQKVTAAIETVPTQQRSYELTGQYAVALNNTGRYREAMEALESVRDCGAEDGAWHYRYAYALYGQGDYSRAIELLHKAAALGREEEELLAECEELLRIHGEKAEVLQRRFQQRKLPDPETEPFAGFDFSGFWDDKEYARREYISDPPSNQLIAELEAELGYKLPRSYIWLMQRHNGGIPFNTSHPASDTSWAEDHIAITGILGIGREKANSLGGSFGSRFWIEEWEYPDIGVAICDCPSAGHDMIFLDYRQCGPQGEPMVVHVDQERDYEITWLADDFESFIRGLVSDEQYEEEY